MKVRIIFNYRNKIDKNRLLFTFHICVINPYLRLDITNRLMDRVDNRSRAPSRSPLSLF